jgi:predicted ATPase
LIKEVVGSLSVNPPILFVQSKLEEFSRAPFSCIKHVANSLLLNFCTLSRRALNEWRQEVIRTAGGGNMPMLIQLFPLLGQIMGTAVGPAPGEEQPQLELQQQQQEPHQLTPAPPANPALLSSTESQARLKLLISNFIRTFATEKRPLVLFFDDIQWYELTHSSA